MTPASRLCRLLAPVACLVVLLAGCARGQPPGYIDEPQGFGATGRIGQIAVTDALLAYQGPLTAPAVYSPGATATLQATIVNEGAQPDRLVSISSPIAGAGQVVGDASLPPRHALTGGYVGPLASVTLPDTTQIGLMLTDLRTEIRAGLTYPVVFTFAGAGDIRLDLPVGNPDQPRPNCPLPPDGKVPQILTAPIGRAPVPPPLAAEQANPPDCGSLARPP